MTRTSLSHPLQISSVSAGAGLGRIGITFCPGKKQPFAMTGAWERDLGMDIKAIADWGASAVITLVEDHELETLGVTEIGREIAAAHMDWMHLPIPDVSAPGLDFERAWQLHGEGIRGRLRDGFDVVVHCKGGLGRAGTVAARLLAELGIEPDDAIREVRATRPGALEVEEQERHVLALTGVPEHQPSTEADAIRDRAVGALLGLAIGDALGTTLEFRGRDTYAPLRGIVGGGPFGLKAGQWTDDTAMALALADSLLASDAFDETDLMERFVRWKETGEYSCTGDCFDIGSTTSTALSKYKRTGNPIAGSIEPSTAGNGSLMRLSPVAIRHWRDRETLRHVAARQSATTHGAPEAVSACVVYADMIADAIAGERRSTVLRDRQEPFPGKIRAIMRGSWRGKHRDQVQSSGYVAHSLEASLWCIGRTADFASAVLLAANLGGDADTTAAITGQLAGAIYGASAIPAAWLGKIAWASEIREKAEGLFG